MSRQPMALLTRKENFSACHRLHSKQLSDTENVQVFANATI